MSAAPPPGDRNIIPRWRDPSDTVRSGELNSALPDAPVTELSEESRRNLEEDWRREGTLPFALDLIGSALVLGPSDTSREAARQVLDAQGISDIAKSIAVRVLGTENDGTLQAGPATGELGNQIGELRKSLRDDPRRTLRWAELSRHYTINGEGLKAWAAMRVALNLAPSHRYILRSASRLAIHLGEFRDAHDIVARSEATGTDPWLMAAEIASSEVAGRRSRFASLGRLAVEREQFSSHSTSELSSALATLDLRAGKDRQARRLFLQSMSLPTENSIAQGQWASKRVRGFEVLTENVLQSPEASARELSSRGEWREAVMAAWQWLSDQPFSSGPAEFGSYEAALGQDYETGFKFASKGLRANPGEFLLTNNLAFCLANMGDLPRAWDAFDEIRPASLSRDNLATYLATAGLLSFRSKRFEEGHRNYQEAIRLMPDRVNREIAQIMYLREMLLNHLTEPTAAEREANELKAEAENPHIEMWLRHLPLASASED